ncbi:hypothetical protein, partial [Methylobacterium longum]|uniref:hypothetical protein n=1 Tax=Methylobacterium longum TaxID=767694 RepID=UPI001EE21968
MGGPVNHALFSDVLHRTCVLRCKRPRPECCSAALSRGGNLQFLSPGTHPAKRETEDQMIKKLLLASAATALMAGAA